MSDEAKAKPPNAIEPHLRPGETLLHWVGAEAADTTAFMWVVLAGIVFIAGSALLQTAFHVTMPPALTLLFMGAITASAVWAFRSARRPCTIGMTDQRVLVVVPRKWRRREVTTVAHQFPMAPSLNIALERRLASTLWGRKIWHATRIDNERDDFLGIIPGDQALTTTMEMIATLKDRRDTTPPAVPATEPRASETAHTNYANLVRLALIPFGVLSAAALAIEGFDVRLSAYFAQLLEAYDSTLQTIAKLIFEPVIHAALAIMRSWLDIELHLLPHWKYVFILWWLVFGAIARAASHMRGYPTAAGLYAWGGICAFAGGVFAGVFPLDGLGLLSSMSSLFFFLAGLHVFDVWKKALGFKRLANGIAILFFLVMSVSAIGAGFYDPRNNAFGLQAAATTIGLGALLGLSASIAESRKKIDFWQSLSTDPIATACIDILSVLGGAAAIVFVGHIMA